MPPHTDRIAADLARQIHTRLRDGSQPFVVAIDGRSGSGKSTLAEALESHLDAVVIAGDDFYTGGTEVRTIDPAALADRCIDRRQLRRVLTLLGNGEAASYAPFDWSAFDGRLAPTPTRVIPAPVVIAEGVYTNHPDLRDLVDLAVLLATPPAECERRLLLREGTLSAWERQWHRAEDRYFENPAAPAHFDYIVESTPASS